MEKSKRNRKYCVVELSGKIDVDDSGKRFVLLWEKDVGVIECVGCPTIWEWVGHVRRYKKGLRLCSTTRT